MIYLTLNKMRSRLLAIVEESGGLSTSLCQG